MSLLRRDVQDPYICVRGFLREINEPRVDRLCHDLPFLCDLLHTTTRLTVYFITGSRHWHVHVRTQRFIATQA